MQFAIYTFVLSNFWISYTQSLCDALVEVYVTNTVLLTKFCSRSSNSICCCASSISSGSSVWYSCWL